jgi:hypothetical protein
MSSLALITAEMHKLNSRAQECDAEIGQLEAKAKGGVFGQASLTVLGCEEAAGKLAVDESKINVTVAMNLGDTESSSKDAKVKEGIDFDVNTMEEILHITCHYDKKGTGPIGDSEDISEQASVVVIPFKAQLAIKEVSTDMAMTTTLEGKCDETTEVLGIRVQIVVDKIEDLVASRRKESTQIESSLGELQKALKAENAAQAESAKKEKAEKTKKAQVASSKPKTASGTTGVSPKSSTNYMQMAMQMGQFALGMAYSSGSYLLFGSAVTIIYFYGDYASI